jgi:hypothetical protein
MPKRSWTALCLALTVAGVAASPAVAERHVTRMRYDDFHGGSASYVRKWLPYYSLERQFGATNLPSFSRRRLRLRAEPFIGWMNDTCVPGFPACANADHIK